MAEALLAKLVDVLHQHEMLVLRPSLQMNLRHLQRSPRSDDLEHLWNRLDDTLANTVGGVRGAMSPVSGISSDDILLSTTKAYRQGLHHTSAVHHHSYPEYSKTLLRHSLIFYGRRLGRDSLEGTPPQSPEDATRHSTRLLLSLRVPSSRVQIYPVTAVGQGRMPTRDRGITIAYCSRGSASVVYSIRRKGSNGSSKLQRGIQVVVVVAIENLENSELFVP
jgi:hypothetical protein